MARAGPFRFGKELRLRQRREFLAVQKQGRRRRGRYLVVIGWRRADGGPVRLGVTASRRVGNAVVRNRIKRRIREAFRLHRQQLPSSLDLVVVAKHEAVGAGLAEISDELLQAARAISTPRRPRS